MTMKAYLPQIVPKKKNKSVYPPKVMKTTSVEPQSEESLKRVANASGS